jgi:hypothetical protein
MRLPLTSRPPACAILIGIQSAPSKWMPRIAIRGPGGRTGSASGSGLKKVQKPPWMTVPGSPTIVTLRRMMTRPRSPKSKRPASRTVPPSSTAAWTAATSFAGSPVPLTFVATSPTV